MGGIMEAWLILSKLFIVVYISFYSITDNTKSIQLTVLCLLIFMILNTFMYIIKGKRAKKICLSLSLVMIMFFCIYVSPIFILLMPINIYEMIVELKASPLIGIIISLTLISIVNNEFIKDYILVASLAT